MRLILLLLALLFCLPGCGRKEEPLPAPPTEEVRETVPAEPEVIPAEIIREALTLPGSQPIYIYEKETTALVLDSQGNVVLEVTDGKAEPLKDAQTGEYLGVTVKRQTDGQQRMDFYDLQGQSILTDVQGQDAEIQAGLLCVYTNFNHGACHLFRWTDGASLYDHIDGLQNLGTTVFLDRAEDRTDLLLDSAGQVLREFPPKTKAEAQRNEDGNCYLVWCPWENWGLPKAWGLLDTRGQEIWDCAYDRIYGVSGGCALVQQEKHNKAVDIATGETRFESDFVLTALLPDAAVIWDSRTYTYQLIDARGGLLLDRWMDEIQVCDLDSDGEPDVLLCTYEAHNRQYTACLDLDGTERWIKETEGQVLYDGGPWGLMTRETDGKRQPYHDQCLGVYLATGDEVLLKERCQREKLDSACVKVTYFNVQGEERSDIVMLDGTVLLEDLVDCRFLGGNVVRCDQGLLRFDGTWLYLE